MKTTREMLCDIDEFTRAYLDAALWLSTDDTNPDRGGEPLDDNYGHEDIEPTTLAEMIDDCRKFQERQSKNLVNVDDACAGHDFWLTRNGHGAGFWDEDYPEREAWNLAAAADSFGEYNISASVGGTVVKL